METASKRACTAAVNVTHMVDRPKRFSRLLPRSSVKSWEVVFPFPIPPTDYSGR